MVPLGTQLRKLSTGIYKDMGEHHQTCVYGCCLLVSTCRCSDRCAHRNCKLPIRTSTRQNESVMPFRFWIKTLNTCPIYLPKYNGFRMSWLAYLKPTVIKGACTRKPQCHCHLHSLDTRTKQNPVSLFGALELMGMLAHLAIARSCRFQNL